MEKRKILKLPETIQVIYCKTINECITICRLIEINQLNKFSVWSFDCEWKINYNSNNNNKSNNNQNNNQNKVALIQLCHHNLIILFHIYIYGIPEILINFLYNLNIIKVGLNINCDLQKLRRDYPELFPKIIPSGVDLRKISEVVEIPPSRSLAGMVLAELNHELPKPHSIRCGNWENYPLSREQIYYASLDVYAGYLIYQKLITRFKNKRLITDNIGEIDIGNYYTNISANNFPSIIDGEITNPLFIMLEKNSSTNMFASLRNSYINSSLSSISTSIITNTNTNTNNTVSICSDLITNNNNNVDNDNIVDNNNSEIDEVDSKRRKIDCTAFEENLESQNSSNLSITSYLVE